MTIHAHATYRAGAIHPDQPLGLAENTEVNVVIVPVGATEPTSPDDIEAVRPKAPRFTREELRQRLARHAVRVGTLPADFSREDIYSDHD
jgi:hypothetical protein